MRNAIKNTGNFSHPNPITTTINSVEYQLSSFRDKKTKQCRIQTKKRYITIVTTLEIMLYRWTTEMHASTSSKGLVVLLTRI